MKKIILVMVIAVIMLSWMKVEAEVEWLEFSEDAQFVDTIKELAENLPPRVARKLANDQNDQTIYVSSAGYRRVSDDELELAVKGCFLHELGHRYDMMCWGFSYGKEMSMVYLAEKELFKQSISAQCFGSTPEYCTKDVYEYFASAFAEYILYPEELEELCPQTFAYMAERIEEVEVYRGVLCERGAKFGTHFLL